MLKHILIQTACIFAIIFTGCKKDSSELAHINIYLTDAPGFIEEANFDLRALELRIAGHGTERIDLAREGGYDILKYTNGHDTLLATLSVNPGFFSFLSLFIGAENNIKINGETRLLLTPNFENGIGTMVGDTLIAGKTYNYWLDVDVYQSVISYDWGGFELNPVYRVYSNKHTGSIIGEVLPAEVKAYIKVFSENDTLGTIAANNGKFRLNGVKAGVYTIEIKPQTIAVETIILDSIVVANTKTTDAGRVYFFK